MGHLLGLLVLILIVSAGSESTDSLPYCGIDRHTLTLLYKFEEMGCNVMVQRDDFGDIRPDSREVLFCAWEKDKGTYSCQADDGYIVIAPKDNSVTVKLVNASSRHDGTYVCQLSNCNYNTKIILFNFSHSEASPHVFKSDLKTDFASTGGKNQGETVLTKTSGDGVKAEGMKDWTIAVIVLSIALLAGISIAVAVFIRKKAQTSASNDRVGNSDGDSVCEHFLPEQERSQLNEMILSAHRFPQHDNFHRRQDHRQQNHVEGARDPCRQQNNVENPEDPCSRQNDVEGPEGPCLQLINMAGTVDIYPQQNAIEGPGAPSQENNGERPVDPCPRQYFDGLVDPRSQQTKVEGPGAPSQENNGDRPVDPCPRQYVDGLVDPRTQHTNAEGGGGPCSQQTNIEEDISPQEIDVEGSIDSHSQKNKADGKGGCAQQEGIEGPGGPFQQNNSNGPADPCPHENNDEEPEYPCPQQNDNFQGPGDSFPPKFGEPDKLAAASKTEVDNTEADNSNTRLTRPHTESTDRSVSVKERVRDYEKRQ